MKTVHEKMVRPTKQIPSGSFSSCRISWGRFFLATSLLILCILPLRIQACGLSWSEPKSHFEGVDYQGNVMVVKRLGEVDAGQGVVLPLYMVFGSGSGNNSPYGGYGWTLPLLESKIVQQDDNAFKVEQPDGWFRLFWRDKNNPNILNGQGNWKAEINGDTITASADCGVKLVYRKGRLVSMQLKERTFEFIYEGNIVTELREGGAVLLWVEREQATGEVIGFKFADSQMVCVERNKRPRVEVINNQNVVGGMDNSLSKVTQIGGHLQTVEYGVDEKLNPTMKMEDRTIVWNPATKKVIKDGDWVYDINSGPGIYENAAIGRENEKKQSEYWYNNQAGGQEITVGIDGTKQVKKWFVSGKLNGAIRTIEETKDNKTKITYAATYDENANLFRETLANGSVNQFKYNDKGEKISVTKTNDGKTIYVADYEKGRLTAARSRSGRTVQNFYDERGREIRKTIDGKLQSETFYAADKSWEKKIVYDKGAETPSRTFYKEFNSSGLITLEKISEASKNYPEIVRKFIYSKEGQLEKTLDSQQGYDFTKEETQLFKNN